MEKFIEIEQDGQQTMIINVNMIATVERHIDGTLIKLIDGNRIGQKYIVVKDTYDDIRSELLQQS